MKSFVLGLTLWLGLTAVRGENNGQLENNQVFWQWRLANGKIQTSRLEDKADGTSLTCTGEGFRLVLGDGTVPGPAIGAPSRQRDAVRVEPLK